MAGLLGFVALGFDILLVLLGLYFAHAALKLQTATGHFGYGTRLFCWALVFLGFVHMFETVLDFLGFPTEWNEIIHRTLVTTSFLLLIIGFKYMLKDVFIPPRAIGRAHAAKRPKKR